MQAERQARMRSGETPEQHQNRNKIKAERQAASRARETEDQYMDRIGAQAERQAALRATETEDQYMDRLRVKAERQAHIRANQTPEQQLKERSDARARMAALRKYSTAGSMDATQSEDILQGNFRVFCLEDTVDTIGTMTEICNFCHAMKFPKEKTRTTTCCSDGKVDLQPFPRPPERLMDLWMGSDARSRLFKTHARHLNNALCLSSLKVKERDFRGFNPSVVFQGRVHNCAGALLPATGEEPVFAQLCV